MRPVPIALILVLLAGACSNDAPGAEAPPTSRPAVESPAVALDVDGPGRYEAEIQSGEVVRRYVLSIPEEAATPAPVVLVFHGFTSSPARVEDLSQMTAVAEAAGFIVVYPAALGALPAWAVNGDLQGDRDVVFVRDLVAALDASLEIDRSRVFAAGMSNGGGMALRLACEASDLFAAVAPVAAANNVAECDPLRPVPIIAFHGTDDRIVPYEGLQVLGFPPVEGWAAEWARRNRCGAPPLGIEVAADVQALVWPGCEADVELYTVDGGRHGWPGSDRAMMELDSTTSISASEIMWEFFSRHPLR